MNATTTMFEDRLQGSSDAVASLHQHFDALHQMATALTACLEAGGTIWTAGNGGSAAQALHFSEELVGRYRSDRRPLASAMLCGDPTAMSCIANDHGFTEVFARPLQALAREGDTVLVLSTSGRSENIISALHTAQSAACTTIGLLGGSGGTCLDLCDLSLVIDSTDSAFVQDAHQVAIHLLCEAIERWAMEHSA